MGMPIGRINEISNKYVWLEFIYTIRLLDITPIIGRNADYWAKIL